MKGKNEGKNRVLTLAPKKRLHGVVERALEIGEGDVGIDTEPLDLVKDGRVGGIGSIVAVDLAGDDNTQRRRLLFHGVDLDRRSVGAHQQPIAQRLALLVGDHQRVLGVARRMAGGKFSDSKL